MRRERALPAHDRLLATDGGQLVSCSLLASAGRRHAARRRYPSASWRPHRPGVPFVAGPAARGAAWPGRVVGEAGRQPANARLACQPASAASLRARRPPEHLRAHVRDLRPLDAHERVGDPHASTSLAGAPPPRRSAQPGRPCSGHDLPFTPVQRGAGADQAGRLCEDLRDLLGGVTSRAVQYVPRDEGMAVQVRGVEPPRMARSGPTVAWFAHALVVTPYCLPANPVAPTRRCPPGAKLLVSWHLHSVAPTLTGGCSLPVVVAPAGGIVTQRRWSPLVCPSRSQGTPLSANSVVGSCRRSIQHRSRKPASSWSRSRLRGQPGPSAG